MLALAKAVRFLPLSSDEGKKNTLIDDEGDAYLDAEEAHLHPDAHEDGGLACADLQLLERQRSAIVEVMKNLGKNLLTGNFDLLKISLPVKLFEPRSYLQKLADPWVFPRLLNAAAAAQNNPVERLQWVVTYMLAGFHRAFLKWAKPFNPILGETWQAALSDGTSIFLEQVSHHPPVSAFQMFGPHGSYYFHGLSVPTVAYKANAIKTSAKGYRRMEFADGGVIDMTFPAYYIKGLVATGAPRAELSGTAEFVDAKHGLMVVVHFGKVEGADASSLLNRNDAFSGTMYRTKIHPNDEIAAVHGRNCQKSHPSSTNGQVEVAAMVASPGVVDGKGEAAGAIIKRSKSSFGGARGLLARTMTSVRRTTSSATINAEEAVGEVRIPIEHCTGNWLSHLDWGGQRFWTLNEEQVDDWIPDPSPLPSDARFRADLAALAAGDDVGAQRAKEQLEELQRMDKKLRKLGTA